MTSASCEGSLKLEIWYCFTILDSFFFPGKLKSKWSGPFKVQQVFPHEALELFSERTRAFKVNGQRVKLYNPEEPNGERVNVFFTDAKAN